MLVVWGQHENSWEFSGESTGEVVVRISVVGELHGPYSFKKLSGQSQPFTTHVQQTEAVFHISPRPTSTKPGFSPTLRSPLHHLTGAGVHAARIARHWRGEEGKPCCSRWNVCLLFPPGWMVGLVSSRWTDTSSCPTVPDRPFLFPFSSPCQKKKKRFSLPRRKWPATSLDILLQQHQPQLCGPKNITPPTFLYLPSKKSKYC